MKLSRQRNKDCYVFLEDGQIVEEEKDKDSVKIMNENSNSFNDINKTSNNQKDFYDNISKHINCLPKKKTFNKIFIILISIIMLLLAFNIIKIFKYVQQDSFNELNVGVTHFTANEKNKKDLFFISDVIQNSNSNIKEYYDELNIIVQNNNSISFKSDILEIQSRIQNNLNDVNNLNSYIDYNNFEKPISILRNRFNNVFDLCTTLLNSSSSSNINNYNSYAQKEIELQNNLILILCTYFEKLNIEYKILDDNTFVYDKK